MASCEKCNLPTLCVWKAKCCFFCILLGWRHTRACNDTELMSPRPSYSSPKTFVGDAPSIHQFLSKMHFPALFYRAELGFGPGLAAHPEPPEQNNFFFIFFGKWEDLVIHAQIPQAVIPTCRRATKASGEHAIRCASRNFDRKSLLNTPFETFRHSMFAIASFWFMCAILFRQLSFFPSAPTRFNMNSHPARTLNRKLPIKLPNLRYRMPKTVCEWVSRACMPK